MKKSKIKKAVNDAMKIYYESGYTNTANKVRENIFRSFDKLYNKQKRNKR